MTPDTIDTIASLMLALALAAIGSGALVEAVRLVVAGLWPARTVSLRWLWRPLAILAGGAAGALLEWDAAHVLVGLGGGAAATTAADAVRARVRTVIAGSSTEPKP